MTLAQARKQAKKSRAELARLIGLKTGAAIGHYETGKRTPTAWRAREIEKALGLPAGSIDWPRPEEAGA